MRRVEVDVPPRAYEVIVGGGALSVLSDLMPPNASRAAIVTQAAIPLVVDPGIDHRVFVIAPGEEAKSLSTIEELCSGFASWGLSRSDVVIAVGGGVVTDVGGFAAAVYHRGVDVVHVATSLLGQVDAAIGGKTGVNLREGKNLVGAFWQPRAVICDTDVLATLPEREWRSGLGEVAKYHFLGEPSLADLDLEERVARCVALKARFVADDERESGQRAHLNYGHTLAHALEIVSSHTISHGEAVAVGLVFAARLARMLDRIDETRVDGHRQVLEGYGLPWELPSGLDADELVTLMARDKKHAGGGLTFVLDGPGGVSVQRVPVEVVRACLLEAGAS